MRISSKSSGVGSAQGVAGAKASGVSSSAPVAASAATDAMDAVQVSSAARLVAVAQEALAVVPDVRMEKVEAIKSQLDTDSYNPDGEAVAEGLIKEHLASGRHS
ncbi:flagellar biosynthesis anti-sigma factor FlgM [Geothrix sp. PMB-07]|uniref:flagellar biosynthesis anti-sigma factor FlgM n=1 Tax=Geothrix sp. PMB-07 TaxID=3068640 RepID=UPI0027403B33|nr:flagellar biosynthesis anti-sigma factor FlgM [Geothrix sp. PMB-07]WLT32924.1 flagellar biosynthesis anti-sigma factor FlgM [Geothrix sp. PMB-07]